MHSMIVKREVLIGIVFRVIFLHEGTASDCDECADYLISGPRGISDDKLTASSTFRNDGRHLYDTKYSRLHFIKNENPVAGAWSAGTSDDQQYIQAEFPDVKFVKSIVTQGRATMDQWVTSYSVSYSNDGSIWSTVKDVNDITAIYLANNDRSTVVMNTLPDCLEAKYIRIHPKTWHSFVSLRLDLIGCSRLDTEIPRNKMNWKRHPIMFSQEIKQNLTQVFETSTHNINVCAVKCQQNSLCLSFLLNQRSGTCIGFQEQAYEESTASFSSLGDDAYFITLSQESHFYVDGSHRNGQWKYVTDTEIPTTLWSPSHPLSEKGDCVTLTLNGLETQNCMNSLYFICGEQLPTKRTINNRYYVFHLCEKQLRTTVINLNNKINIEVWLNNDQNIYIGRDMSRKHEKLTASMWANPFPCYKYGRDTCLEMYKNYILKQYKLLNSLHQLKGKTLGCFCGPKRCHGDVLISLLSNTSDDID